MTRTITSKSLLLLATLLCTLGTPFAFAERPEQARHNHVTALSFEEDAHATQITIHVASEPTFSIYPLRNPARLLVEISDCGLDSPLAPLEIRNGVVDRAAATEESQSARCRVTLAFDSKAHYDVETTSDAIVVSIDGEGRTEPPLSRAAPVDDGASEKLAAASRELARLDLLRSQSAQRVQELEARIGALSETEARNARLQQSLTAERAQLMALQESSQGQSALVAQLQSQLTTLSQDHSQAQQRIAALAQQRDAAINRAQAAELRAATLASDVTTLSGSLQQRRTQDQQQLTTLSTNLESAQLLQQQLKQEVAGLQQQLDNGDVAAKTALDAKTTSLQQAQAQVTTLSTNLEALRAESARSLSELQTSLDNKNLALQGARARLRALETEKTTSVQALNQKLAERDRKLTAQQSELKGLREREVTLRGQLVEMQQESQAAREAQKALSDLKQRQNTLEAELRASVNELNTALASSRTALQQTTARESTLKIQYQTLTSQHEQAVQGLTSELQQKETALSTAQLQLQSLANEVENLKTAARGDDALQGELQKKQASLTLARAEQDRLSTDVATLQQSLSSNQLELEQLRAQVQASAARAQTRDQQLQSERSKIQGLVAGHQKELELERAAKQQLAQKLTASQTEVTQLRADLDVAQTRAAELEALQARLDDEKLEEGEAQKLRAQLAAAQTQAAQVKTLEAQLTAAQARAAQAETLETQLTAAQARAAQADALETQLAEANQRAETLAREKSQPVLAAPPIAAIPEDTGDAAPLDFTAERGGAGAAPIDPRLAAAAKRKPPVDPVAAERRSPPIDPTLAAAAPQERQPPVTTADAPIDADVARVKDIRFEQDARNTRVMRVIIELEGGDASYETDEVIGGARATLALRGADLPESLQRRFDTAFFKSGLSALEARSNADGGVVLTAELAGTNNEIVRREDNLLIWEFAQISREASSPIAAAPPPAATGFGGAPRPMGADMGGASTRFVDRREKVRIAAAPPQGRFGETATSDSLRTRYGANAQLKSRLSRNRITLKVRDADINDLLRLLAEVANLSIVTSPEVQGNVTLSLNKVPLGVALETILESQGYWYRQKDNILWVAPREVFEEELARIQAAQEAGRVNEPLEVRLIPVNYAQAAQLQENLQSILSSRGSVQVDPRTNTLILKDVAQNLDAAEILVDSLDTQTPQILIEARIVETQSNFRQEFGVQWGGDFSFSPQNGNPTGLVFPSSIGVAGGSDPTPNAGTAATPNFAVNLPAAVGQGSGGAIGMTFGSVGGTVNLNLRLSAMEENGFVKIVSAPRVVTLDNVEASISQGVSIPVSVVSAAGVQTVFFDANLNLTVLPHVTKDGNIFLRIDVTKNEPDFSRPGASGDPSIIRKEAHTQLLVPDGDTTVIGGIYTRNTSQSMSSVPWIGRVPIIGYFFRRTVEADDRTELLIFITPRIINRESSIGVSGPGSFLAPSRGDGDGN